MVNDIVGSAEKEDIEALRASARLSRAPMASRAIGPRCWLKDKCQTVSSEAANSAHQLYTVVGEEVA